LAATWFGVLYAACHRGDPEGTGGSDADSANATTTTGFSSDGADICGNEYHDALSKYPLIYFVLDRSGSMSDLEDGVTRYEKVRLATLELVDSLGALVRVGLTLYPSPNAGLGSECLAGEEVYSPKVNPGSQFENALDVEPIGGTPTAATLQAVRPHLSNQPAPKVVILATDGAPNCNSALTCGADSCIVNIAGQCPIANCCEPPEGVVENCLDYAATLDAIDALVAEGTNVYVVGIPGSELFGTALNGMALHGNVPLTNADQYYYKVDDLDGLAEVFKGIARELVSCTFDLTDPPEEQGLTNVYFDGNVVYLDPENGWTWVDGDTVELVGAACESLKDGQVEQVQIVSGCPTETPK
jgi:hypothetical protein